MWFSRGSRIPSESHTPLPAAGKTLAAPDLSPDDIELVHGLWLELSEALSGADLHHSDVVALALQHLQREFEGQERDEILASIRRTWVRQPEGRTGPAITKAGTTTLGIDTPMLKPITSGIRQTRRSADRTPSLQRAGDRRRRDQVLAFWSVVLTFCIPTVLLLGVIWNPSGVRGDAVMASLALLVLSRLGIALVRRGAIDHRDRQRQAGQVC